MTTQTPIDMLEPPAPPPGSPKAAGAVQGAPSGGSALPKHTPWAYDHATRTVRGTDGKNVCLVSEAASGHLLAEAPVLLRELKAALAALDGFERLLAYLDGYEGDGFTTSTRSERIRAAIDRAEGQHE